MAQEKIQRGKKTKKGNGMRGKGFIIAVLILCIAGLLVFGGIFLRNTWIEYKATELMKDMRESAFITTDTTNQTLDDVDAEVAQVNVDFDSLRQINEDIYAWICVPGTDIDYPVVQHPSDDTYYMGHNLDGSSGYPGCIYSEHEVNSKSFEDQNTVLYGHNMRNGKMFAGLHSFSNKDFFDTNRYVYIYVPSGTLVYKIFAAYEYSNVHLLKGIDISTREAFQKYIDSILGMSSANIAADAEVNADSRILTLETCTDNSSRRYIVQAVLLNER